MSAGKHVKNRTQIRTSDIIFLLKPNLLGIFFSKMLRFGQNREYTTKFRHYKPLRPIFLMDSFELTPLLGRFPVVFAVKKNKNFN